MDSPPLHLQWINLTPCYFTTTSVFSIVIIFLWIISLSSADYNLVNGETGKYRWFDTAAQIHRSWFDTAAQIHEYAVIVLLVDIFDLLCSRWFDTAAQIHRRVMLFHFVFFNPTQDEINQTGKNPSCICEHKMGLKPEFVGCVLPNNSHVSQVEWTCDNVFRSLNVSVYTTCA
ncbi:unnamed protein product [Mytilus edulis]|uniref:Uncharacterized protein n=1 Tax=Mytilus edulis TaxID=6550 RepID=A0A8S3R9D2_MYTED|nr:unnamed protein product [Mytilus edulis]